MRGCGRGHGRRRALSNLQQIGLAISQYATDYDESLPPAANGNTVLDYANWRTLIFTYTRDNGVFACPSNPFSRQPGLYGTAPLSYVANATLLTSPPVTLVNPNQIEFPSLLFMVGEGSGAGFIMHTPPNNPLTNPLCAVSGIQTPGGASPPGCDTPEGPPPSSTDLYAGHDGFSNYLFADGHVRALKPTALCKGMDMWSLSNSNSGLPCSAALQTALAANEKYWTQTTQP